MEIEQHRAAIRFALVYLMVTVGIVAAWILISPKHFYDEFPGLGLAALAGLAAVWMERRLVQAAAVALFLGTLPHAIYHSTETGAMSTADNVVSLGGIYLQVLLPLLVLYLASGERQARRA
jgi:uncharacterized membrane protein